MMAGHLRCPLWIPSSLLAEPRCSAAAIPPAQLARRVEVPSGISLFPGDILRPPRGGHFAPFEEPELYAQELRESFRPYR
jgi:hypothetical protein